MWNRTAGFLRARVTSSNRDRRPDEHHDELVTLQSDVLVVVVEPRLCLHTSVRWFCDLVLLLQSVHWAVGPVRNPIARPSVAGCRIGGMPFVVGVEVVIGTARS
jgi:hypothetical protein